MRMLPTMQVYSMPLVGVWVRGVRSVSHPVVLAACLRFAYASTLPDKALQPDSSFLLAVFLPGGCGVHAQTNGKDLAGGKGCLATCACLVSMHELIPQQLIALGPLCHRLLATACHCLPLPATACHCHSATLSSRFMQRAAPCHSATRLDFMMRVAA